MDEPIDNEHFDLKKKALEIEKLEKEIVKLDREGTELKWRKWSSWGAAIIAICSVAIVGLNGYLTDSKSKLVAEETKNQQAKNDTSRAIFQRDSLNLISQKNIIQKQLDSLSQRFRDDKIKFDKERAKYGYVISQKEKEIGGLRNEKNKIEECLIKAKEFLKHCIRYDEYEPELYNQESLIRGYKPPYKTRFSLTLEEVANLNIISMTYDQFLKDVAGYKAIGQTGVAINDVIYSSDGKKSIVVKSNGGGFQMTARNSINEIRSQFECYKGLPNTQKLKLLKQMIIRTY
jgi:hypothetical protein